MYRSIVVEQAILWSLAQRQRTGGHPLDRRAGLSPPSHRKFAVSKYSNSPRRLTLIYRTTPADRLPLGEQAGWCRALGSLGAEDQFQQRFHYRLVRPGCSSSLRCEKGKS